MTNVVEFPNANLRDIPTMLRQLADDIEAEVYGKPFRMIAILDAEQVHSFGWGDSMDMLTAIGLLEIGKNGLIEMMFE